MRVWAMRCGHGAFVMLAGMYFMTDVVLLRVLGIAANLLDMAYCSKVDPKGPMWLNIRWGALYVGINVVQLAFLYSEMRSVDLDPELSETYRAHFESHGVSQSQFRKLILSATPVEFRDGEIIQQEGETADGLVLMTSGAASVSEDGVQVASVDSTFAGSLAFLVDADSTYQATFAAHGAVRAYRWRAEELKAVLQRNPSLAVSVRAMLQHELLKFNKGALSFVRIGSYTQLLRGVLVDGVVAHDERAFCDDYRRSRSITDAEHEACLASAGWTVEQWRAGKGPGWAAAHVGRAAA